MFSYADSLCKTFPGTGVEVTWDGGANKTQGILSPEIWGIKAVGTGQGRLAANINTDTYVDFNTLGHDKNQDLKWQMKIPLATLKVDKSYIESNGIGVMFVLSDGGSGMDCLPWDATMVDNADKPYSKDESTSAEKEDEDIITTPFARCPFQYVATHVIQPKFIGTLSSNCVCSISRITVIPCDRINVIAS